MAKYRILTAAAAPGVIASLDAPGRAARLRGTPGSSIAPLSPATWDGTGSPPVGWTIPNGVLPEAGGSRIAVVATDAFASGRPEFSSALDALPADWAGG